MALNIAASAASHSVVKLSKSLPKYPLRFSFCITPWHLALQLSFKNPNQADEAYINSDIRVARVTFQRAGPLSPWDLSMRRALPVWAHRATTFEMWRSKDRVSVTVTPKIFKLEHLVTPAVGWGTDRFPSLTPGLWMIISMNFAVLSMRLLRWAHSDICSSSNETVWEFEDGTIKYVSSAYLFKSYSLEDVHASLRHCKSRQSALFLIPEQSWHLSGGM